MACRRTSSRPGEGLPHRLAAGPLRCAARLHRVPGADESGVRSSGSSGSASKPGSPTVAAQAAVRAIAPLAEVPVGGVRAFHYPEARRSVPAAAARRTDVRGLQPEVHASLLRRRAARSGRNATARAIVGTFDLDTGRPLAGPPRRPLPRITLEIRGGIIYATGVEVNNT